MSKRQFDDKTVWKPDHDLVSVGDATVFVSDFDDQMQEATNS